MPLMIFNILKRNAQMKNSTVCIIRGYLQVFPPGFYIKQAYGKGRGDIIYQRAYCGRSESDDIIGPNCEGNEYELSCEAGYSSVSSTNKCSISQASLQKGHLGQSKQNESFICLNVSHWSKPVCEVFTFLEFQVTHMWAPYHVGFISHSATHL